MDKGKAARVKEKAKMADEIAFKEYVDCFSTASARTRNSIYLLVAVLVVIYGVYFNTQVLPFAASRMQNMEMAYNCVKNSSSSADLQRMLASPPCQEPLNWAKRMDLPVDYDNVHLPPSERWSKADVIEMYKDTLNSAHQKRADLRTVTIPIFGSTIDIEDLGLLSGVSFLILLLIVGANMRRELDWLRAAYAKADSEEKKAFLRGIQVLASSRPDNRLFRWIPVLIFGVAPLVHFLIWRKGIITPQNINLLIGRAPAHYLIGAEVTFLILIIFFALWDVVLWALLIEALNDTPGHWTRSYNKTKWKL